QGAALFHLQRYEESLAAYDRALALDSESAYLWENKGDSFEALGRHEEALAAYERALALEPDDAGVWRAKAQPLQRLGRLDEAISAANYLIDHALSLEPSYTALARAWAIKANALRNLRRNAEALEAYDRAVAIDPKDSGVWYGKGQALLNLKRYDEALE